jgi:3-phenylpropionate/trans-cinnamate dioxygenase ferredoxin subunit
MMQENVNFQKYKIFDSWEDAQKQVKHRQMYAHRIGFKKILIANTSEGFFALEDACPHKLVKLSRGLLLNDLEVECYWHKYRFNLKTGEECTEKNIRPVKTYQLSEEENGIYLHLPEETEQDPFSF